MPHSSEKLTASSLMRELLAGVVVYFVALPLCMGVAQASEAPITSGLIAGAIGGIVVGLLSGSRASVSGPAAGLTAVVATSIAKLGSFEAFLLAVVIGGVLQLLMGAFRLGFIAEFFPTCVIRGLLAAIGVILILKQIPHLFGHDKDPEGDMAFVQPDNETTFSELVELLSHIHPGAALIGLSSIAALFLWDQFPKLKKSLVPAPLLIVLFGVLGSLMLKGRGESWEIGGSHLVDVPLANSWSGFQSLFHFPNWNLLLSSDVWVVGVTIAAVASLETLLNLEAVDKLDPAKRKSPPNRELLAQGLGNTLTGLIGGLPVTSVIVRSSANLNAGAKTRISSVFHGLLLVGTVVTIPAILNLIPLSALAAILLHIGVKLASPDVLKKMWLGGWSQFVPFVVTVVAIVTTDLLIGVSIGLAVAIVFILKQSSITAVRVVRENHLGGEIQRVVLADQVSFLDRASISRALYRLPPGSQVLLDARTTDYIDPDVVAMLEEFTEEEAEARKLNISTVGFQHRYSIPDLITYVDYSSRDLQRSMTPEQVLEVLREGNRRFLSGHRLTRDLVRQVDATSTGQFPIAAVLGCIDSRTPTELIFDVGMGDVFTIRIAGNVSKAKVMGSLEYATAVAGAKLIVVMGHTRCGAVTAAVDLYRSHREAMEATGCDHLDSIVEEIQRAIRPEWLGRFESGDARERQTIVDAVAEANVYRVAQSLPLESKAIDRQVTEGNLKIVGAMYDVSTGQVRFIDITEPQTLVLN